MAWYWQVWCSLSMATRRCRIGAGLWEVSVPWAAGEESFWFEHGLAVAAVLALLSETYRLAVYSALSYLSSQLLVAALRADIVRAVASWQEDLRHSAWSRCRGAVRVACLCGACSW
eukprot:s6372_g3.t1